MQISIIGTGAMATLFAARLADVADVSMIGSWADAHRNDQAATASSSTATAAAIKSTRPIIPTMRLPPIWR